MLKKYTLTGDNGRDMTPEINNFINFIGLERAAPNRYSILLVLGLFGSCKSGLLNPAKVIQEIKSLEGISSSGQCKPATQFKHPPLKGLWHKHYLDDGLSSMGFNIEKGLNKYGSPLFAQRIQEANASGEKRFISINDIPLLASDMVQGNWMRLAEENALTGEWLIYAKYMGENYYLCLGKHGCNDNDIRNQIDAICCVDFPFLSELLCNVS